MAPWAAFPAAGRPGDGTGLRAPPLSTDPSALAALPWVDSTPLAWVPHPALQVGAWWDRSCRSLPVELLPLQLQIQTEAQVAAQGGGGQQLRCERRSQRALGRLTRSGHGVGGAGGLTWEALLCTRRRGGGMGKEARGWRAKPRPRALRSCGGRVVSTVGTSVQTPASLRLGQLWARHIRPRSLSPWGRLRCPLAGSLFQNACPGSRSGQVGVPRPKVEGGWGWGMGRSHTHQQGWAADQMKVVVKGLLALVPGEGGLGCWDHQPLSQLLKVLVPGN